MDKNQDQKEADSFAKWILWTFCIVLPLWLSMGWLAFNIKSIVGVFSAERAASIEPGTFGDMFGAANALFSAMAFAVIVITLWLQIKELREAREDRKTNLEHQEVIARSQERAAEMQLKVAQSGDVLKAYQQVAGSEFGEKMQRLRWLVDVARTVTIDGYPVGPERLFVFKHLIFVLSRVQQMRPPVPYMSPGSSSRDGSVSLGTNQQCALRVHEDIAGCVRDVLDLRGALALGLLHAETIRLVLSPDDCRLIAIGSETSRPSYAQEARFLEEIADMLESNAKAETMTASRSTPT